MTKTITQTGYVMDVNCIQTTKRTNLLDVAQGHRVGCVLNGIGMQSGYGLVTDDDRLVVLDRQATPKIVEVALETQRDQGLPVRVERELDGPLVRTTDIEEIH